MVTTIYLGLLASYGFYFWVALHPEQRVAPFLALLLSQSVLWTWLFKKRISSALLFTGVILTFLIVRHTPPLYENDFFRYFFDGVQLWNGHHPYAEPPDTVSIKGLEEIQAQINFPALITIYPPMAELLFAALVGIGLQKLSLFLWLLTGLGALAFGFSFHRLLKNERKGDALTYTLLFLQHPILVKEWYQSCHYDIWMTSALVLAYSCRSPYLRVFWLGLGVQLKFTAVAAIASLSFKNRKEFSFVVGVFFLTLFLPTLLFYSHLPNMIHSLFIFSAEWEMNSGIYRVFNYFSETWNLPAFLARILCALSWVLTMVTLFYFGKTLHMLEKVFWLLFTMVIFSPVANTWYFTWSLPFAVFLPEKRQKLILYAFCLTPLSYAFFLRDTALYEALWNIEYIGIFLILILIVVKARGRNPWVDHHQTGNRNQT